MRIYFAIKGSGGRGFHEEFDNIANVVESLKGNLYFEYYYDIIYKNTFCDYIIKSGTKEHIKKN